MSPAQGLSTLLLATLCLDARPGAPARPRQPPPGAPPTVLWAHADTVPADTTTFAAIVRGTQAALDTLRRDYQADQAALDARLQALQAEAAHAQRAVARAAEWRDTLRLVRAQVQSLQAATDAARARDALASAATARAQTEAYGAGLRALSRMDGVLSASLGYLAAYHASLESQRALSLWADPGFRNLWDTADRVGTAAGLALAGYYTLRGGDEARPRAGIGLSVAALARVAGWLFGDRDRFRPDAVRTQLEFVSVTRTAFDDIALSQQQADSLRQANAALLAELLAFKQRYLAAEAEPARRPQVLAELAPFLGAYVEALRQPLLLMTSRRTVLTVYASYDLPAGRRAQLEALIDTLREQEQAFGAALRADAAEVDALRALLERAATGAVLSELLGRPDTLTGSGPGA